MTKTLIQILAFTSSLAVAGPSEDVQALFTPHFDADSPGCSVSVLHDGQVAYEGGFGSSRLPGPGEGKDVVRAMGPQTRVRMASVTKPVLAAGLLHLRENLPAGQKDLLERTLADVYPRELAGTVFAGITVKQLLEHTSTLVREPPEDVPSEPALALWMKKAGATLLLPGHQPGGHWEYSNLGFMLAADILSKLSGLRWTVYLKRYFFDPLGMADTSVEDPLPLQKAGQVAEGYAADGAGFVFEPVSRLRRVLLGSGGLISTAQDMSRFNAAVEEGKILSNASWSLAFTASAASVADQYPYGLGWALGSDKVSHNGGGFGSSTRIEVSRSSACRLSVATLCNLNREDFPAFDDADVARSIRKIYCGSRP